jgi:hypothetical protein
MDEMFTRYTTEMLARVSGPMKFRLVLQPLMASFFAIRDGLKDARGGGQPYFWKLVTDRADRKEVIENGWKSVGKIFILAVVLDVVYQLYELHTVYPIQAFSVAIILAIVPYLILRGLTTRLVRTETHLRAKRRETPPGGSMTDTTADRHA